MSHLHCFCLLRSPYHCALIFTLYHSRTRTARVYNGCLVWYNVLLTPLECPRYLADIVQPTSSRVTRSGLRSLSETASYITPRLRTKFGERAFSFSGPASWNSLPTDLRTVSDTSDFKKKLKTYLFKLAFDIQQTPLFSILSISRTFSLF